MTAQHSAQFGDWRLRSAAKQTHRQGLGDTDRAWEDTDRAWEDTDTQTGPGGWGDLTSIHLYTLVPAGQ
jgi:hypothetical protein